MSHVFHSESILAKENKSHCCSDFKVWYWTIEISIPKKLQNANQNQPNPDWHQSHFYYAHPTYISEYKQEKDA